MAKFVDFYSDRGVQDVMEAFIKKYPDMFDGFDTTKIGFVTTRKKKGRQAVKLHRVKYPHDVWMNKVYIVETIEQKWKTQDDKRKHLHVFKLMCSIPSGGFDEQSKDYGKVLKPDFQMYLKEYAASGGVPNWEENAAAQDPLEEEKKDVQPVSAA